MKTQLASPFAIALLYSALAALVAIAIALAATSLRARPAAGGLEAANQTAGN